jgi:hypothetical protein
MSPARLWLSIFAAGYAIVAALFVATLLTPPYRGDLTRIGQLSESRFRARNADSEEAREPAPDSPLAQADVLVVGDSFSIERRWQLDLTLSGLRVAFSHWDEIGALCADFAERLAERGFRGRWVIAETIERELQGRVQDSYRCARMPPVRPPPHQGSTTGFIPRRALLWPELNWGETLLTGVINEWHTRRAARADTELVFANTRVVPMQHGCRLFSHAACEKGLFYAIDLQRSPASQAQLEQMQAIAARPAPWHLVWMVIPDKSTIYLAPDRRRRVSDGLSARCLGPDLFAPLLAARDTMIDLYLPNDTHLSPRGFALVGGVMRRALVEPGETCMRRP